MPQYPQFPRTQVGGLSLPRMLIGSNWLLGFSHKTHPMNHMILERNGNAKAMCEIICAFAKYGIDALMAPITSSQPLMDALNDAEQKLGKRIIRIDTPTINVDDNAAARAEAGIYRLRHLACELLLQLQPLCEHLDGAREL